MLIRFRVRNFLSFRDEVEFSMIPGKAHKHPNHVVVSDQSRSSIDILRAGIIYGANASGKSNLVKAMDFAQDLIIEGTKYKEIIKRTPFKLDKACLDQPSFFEFEFKQNAHAYIYGFELDSRRIHSEWLYEIKKTTQAMLFERKTAPDEQTEVVFENIKFTKKHNREFLHHVATGTRSNQLFLTESIQKDVKFFKDVDAWFRETLVIIFPESQYVPLGVVSVDQDFGNHMVKYLEQLGTGICGFALSEVNPELEFPKEVLADIRGQSQTEAVLHLMTSPKGLRYVIEFTQDGEIKTKKLMFKHKMGACGEETLLGMDEESDGTRRLMDLLPSLTRFGKAERVILVDELDRSLHPNLTYELIKLFLSSTGNQNQLIVTTHEAHLLDLNLLRRDEIWFVEKDESGASKVYSLEEFTPRYDKDIQKGYMLGRFGAIPVMGNISFEEA